MEENYKRILAFDTVLSEQELTDLGVTSTNDGKEEYELAFYDVRVDDGSGAIIDDSSLQTITKHLVDEDLFDNTQLLFVADGGMVQRIDGVLKYIRTGFDVSSNAKNLDGSATATQQPRLIGGIAPNSKAAAGNLNGEARYFTHPEISFGSGDAWSVTTVIKRIDIIVYESIWGKTGNGGSRFGGNNRVNFVFEIGGLIEFDYVVPNGKSISITYVYNSNSLTLYINGVFNQQITSTGSITISQFMKGRNDAFKGLAYYHRIQSSAMTAQQVSDEYNLVRTLYPEIESTIIGTQAVASRSFEAVASTNGTVIADANVTATWVTGASGWCYNNGNTTPDVANIDNGAAYGKLYNKAARNVIIANPPSGWHVATEAELTTLAALGANALKYFGTDYWTTTGGTNTTGFTALGGGSRNADGSFNLIKGTVSFWCADSDKVLKLTDNSNTAEIIAAAANEGHYIRLIKNA